MTIPLETDDHGHLLPDEVWAAVVAGAQERVAHLEALEALDAQPEGLRQLPDRFIRARSYGGTMRPRMGVIHSAETPLAAGYAYSIAANWFATQATTSATVMIDPAETIRLLEDTTVAYHVGPKANGWTVGVEQAGYAKLTLAQWTTPAGLQQMARVAQYMRECRDRLGIPLRWATAAEIRQAALGGPPVGWCYHDDVANVLGGTTHHDPRPNYPGAMLMALANTGSLEGLMAVLDNDDATLVARKLVDWPLVTRVVNGVSKTYSVGQLLIALDDALGVVNGNVTAVPGKTWDEQISVLDVETGAVRGKLSARNVLAGTDRAANLAALGGQVSDLPAAELGEVDVAGFGHAVVTAMVSDPTVLQAFAAAVADELHARMQS